MGNWFEDTAESIRKDNERKRKKNTAIDKKIERLEKARADLNTVREEWAGLKLETLERHGEGLWSGSCNQNEYLDKLEKAKKKVDQVTSDCEVLDNAIVAKIAILSSQVETLNPFA